MICIEAEKLADLPQALRMEWLETDGLGGYACGTVTGASTRRYHGLLMAATTPPVGRRLLVAKLEESLDYDGQHCELSCNVYRDLIHPRGHLYQQGFRLDPWPIFTWGCEGLQLEKSIMMPHGLGVTVVRYRLLEAPGPTWLHSRPLVAGRDMHSLQRANINLEPQLKAHPHQLTLQPYDEPSRLCLQYPGGQLQADGLWYYNFRYLHEEERGLDYIEDLYSPGMISWLLRPGDTAWVVMGREPLGYFDGAALMETERQRRTALGADLEGDPVGQQLATAADQFLADRTVAGQRVKTVIAGYPWFGDWGRDTMIALPGLTLATGRADICADLLRAFAGQLKDGLIPNNFGESDGQASYNTVDATLWLTVALHRHYEATRDLSLAEALWPAIVEILQAHQQGTVNNIHQTADGLLWAGDETTQLTWMDAKVDDWVVTPRYGLAVEINALWYNALRSGEFFARKLGLVDEAKAYGCQAQRTCEAFQQFWAPDLGYCYDCLLPEGPDPSLRPNQIIACALPYQVLSAEQQRSLVQVCGEQLLTPCGLRTLAPDDPDYRGRYRGDRWARDGAYHQGTVWPWLLGSYLTAYFNVQGVTAASRHHVRTLLQPLIDHLATAGLGSISEVFDGDSPHQPGGCFAQAWSVAELLRCWVQYRLGEVEL
jgi:predicted glycogen debranching enzyme